MAASLDQDQQVLQAAKDHDISRLRTLLRTSSASVRDPTTGSTALHQAVLGALPVGIDHDVGNAAAPKGRVAAASAMRLLLETGAIWNDLDERSETPGCLALRLGFKDLYDIIVDAGVRAELLLNRLDEYEALSDGDEDADIEDEGISGLADDVGNATTETVVEDRLHKQVDSSNAVEKDLQSDNYLQSSLRYQHDRLLDDANNGVMMEWEAELMKRHADLLCPKEGLRVLNIGFGMGIIDTAFQAKAPSAHHIVEAHPAVLGQIEAKGWHSKPNVTIHNGRWQDVLPRLLEQGTLFDAIYFDTFAEDYKDFRSFFEESVVGLLEDGGRWSFFNGLGADRQISYDVYSKVVEMDLFESGFEVEWETVAVPEMDEEVWKGVKRKYWALKEYRSPTCRFMR